MLFIYSSAQYGAPSRSYNINKQKPYYIRAHNIETWSGISTPIHNIITFYITINPVSLFRKKNCLVMTMMRVAHFIEIRKYISLEISPRGKCAYESYFTKCIATVDNLMPDIPIFFHWAVNERFSTWLSLCEWKVWMINNNNQQQIG